MNRKGCCDTSVLINFLKINRLDLLEKCSYSFFVTDHVQEEITTHYAEQKILLEKGLQQKIFHKANVETSEEFNLFAELSKSGQLGAGECAAIAIASIRGYYLAIDDVQAIKKASSLIQPNFILRTQDLLLQLIQDRLLEVEEADQLIELWAKKHRFKLKIKSFKELVVLSLKT